MIQLPPPAMAANKNVRVRVTVTGGKYSNIEILQPPRIGEEKTFRALISRVFETQSLSIDAISAEHEYTSQLVWESNLGDGRFVSVTLQAPSISPFCTTPS